MGYDFGVPGRWPSRINYRLRFSSQDGSNRRYIIVCIEDFVSNRIHVDVPQAQLFMTLLIFWCIIWGIWTWISLHNKMITSNNVSDGEIYLCVAQSIQGDTMLNPIEKFKVAILHLNRDWNHWCYITSFRLHYFCWYNVRSIRNEELWSWHVTWKVLPSSLFCRIAEQLYIHGNVFKKVSTYWHFNCCVI